MKTSLFVAVFLGLVALSVAFSLGEQKEEFTSWMQKFGKSYETTEEFNKRFEIYLTNKARVAKLNRDSRMMNKKNGARYGATEFMDMTPKEFSVRLGSSSAGFVKTDVIDLDTLSQSLPTTFDWKSTGCVSAVKNQGQCGSCWAFSSTEGTESAYCIATGKLDILAPQELVSCDNTCDGCNGGNLPQAFTFVENKGLESEADYPYTSGTTEQTGTCKYNANDVEATITQWGYATQTKNETAMQVSLVNTSPLSVLVDAQSWQFYQGGVITSNCGTNLDHAVQITGYNTNSSPSYWVVRNSWGASWGEQGYVWVEMGKNMCGIAEEPCWVKYTSS